MQNNPLHVEHPVIRTCVWIKYNAFHKKFQGAMIELPKKYGVVTVSCHGDGVVTGTGLVTT